MLSSVMKIYQSGFSNNYAPFHGGSLLSFASSLLINGTVFENNIAAFWGGALSVRNGSSLTIEESNFKNNSVFEDRTISQEKQIINEDFATGGGVILTSGSVLNIHQSNFSNNYADITGGSIVSSESLLYINGSVFENNIAGVAGGSIIGLYQSSVIIEYTSFINNSVQDNVQGKERNYSKGGGAIAITKSCEFKIYQSIFSNNKAPFHGGSLFSSESSLLINGSVFENNIAGFWGGAIAGVNNHLLNIQESYFINNSVPVNNTTVEAETLYNNAGTAGGGVFIFGSDLSICQSLFSNNYAYYQGGSLFSMESSIYINDSIFQNNTADILGGAISMGNYTILSIRNSSLMGNTVWHRELGMGGGMMIGSNNIVILSDVTLIENKAGYGAAVYVKNLCEIVIFNSSIIEHTTSAIEMNNENYIKISNCAFYNNSRAVKGASSCAVNITNTEFIHHNEIEGGSIYVDKASSVHMYNCYFTNNSASLKGGVIAAVNSDIKVFSCIFIENGARYGGVFAISGSLFVRDSVMSNNAANGDGGVAYLEENSQVNILDSTFNLNLAATRGGVLLIMRGTVNVWNSSFTQNKAALSGGVISALYTSIINISQTTFYGNRVIFGKGGVVYGGMASRILVSESTIKQNSAHHCGAIIIDASVLEISFSKVDWNRASGSSGSFCAFNNSLFISTTTSFRRNMGYLGGSIIVQNSSGYLENCTLWNIQGIYKGEITISNAELRLSNTEFVHSVVDIESDTSRDKFINKIYTYKCLFEHNNMTLISNSTNFKDIALKEGFLKDTSLRKENNFVTKETEFASGEFFLAKPVLIVLFHCYFRVLVVGMFVPLKIINVSFQFYPNHVFTNVPATGHPGIEPTYSTVETNV